MAALYGTHAAFADVEQGGPNHYFVPPGAVPYNWELGGPSHEACAGVAALPQYLAAIAGPPGSLLAVHSPWVLTDLRCRSPW